MPILAEGLLTHSYTPHSHESESTPFALPLTASAQSEDQAAHVCTQGNCLEGPSIDGLGTCSIVPWSGNKIKRRCCVLCPSLSLDIHQLHIKHQRGIPRDGSCDPPAIMFLIQTVTACADCRRRSDMRQYAAKQALLSDLLKTHYMRCSLKITQASRRLLKRQPWYEQKAPAYIQATAITSGAGTQEEGSDCSSLCTRTSPNLRPCRKAVSAVQ